VRPWLLALSLALASPALAADDPATWSHHVVKKARVIHFDPLQHDLVLLVEGQPLTLHTERARIRGDLSAGRVVDVTYDSERWRAEAVVVRPDRLRTIWAP
jgi:hypothetical protein